MKIHHGVPLRLSDEMLNHMSSMELKELIKSQQHLLISQEQKLLEKRPTSKKKARPKTAGSKGKVVAPKQIL